MARRLIAIAQAHARPNRDHRRGRRERIQRGSVTGVVYLYAADNRAGPLRSSLCHMHQPILGTPCPVLSAYFRGPRLLPPSAPACGQTFSTSVSPVSCSPSLPVLGAAATAIPERASLHTTSPPATRCGRRAVLSWPDSGGNYRPMCDGTSVHASVCFCGKGREHGLYSPTSRTHVSQDRPHRKAAPVSPHGGRCASERPSRTSAPGCSASTAPGRRCLSARRKVSRSALVSWCQAGR